MKKKRKVVKVLTVLAGSFFLSAFCVQAQNCCLTDVSSIDYGCPDGKVTATDYSILMKEFGTGDCISCRSLVPKTGQTTCYDENGNQRICTGTGENGESQKGVNWPNPRFTDNGNGTVTDNLTGLMWLKDANCIATNYPSFDNDDITGDGMVIWQHALDFVKGINEGEYSSCSGSTPYDDWRLPNIKELLSLVYYGVNDPALPNTAGTGKCTEGDPFINVRPSLYWSSTTQAGITSRACYMRIGYGDTHYGVKSSDIYVWPVRGSQ